MSWTSLQQEDNRIQPPLEAGEAPCEPQGEEVQRLSVIQSIPQLLQQDEPQCMQRIIPKVQQLLPDASAEFHVAASSTFLTILEKKLVHPRTFTQTFLQSILSSIDSRDPVVARAWLETLLDVIDLLPASVIKSDILPVAIAKGQIAQPVTSRLKACKLLGKITTRFEPYLVKKEVLPLIHSLCQDINYEVRASICSQFHYFAKALDAETVEPDLLTILVELASDEESLVRLHAVETIVNMLPHLQPDAIKYTVIPLVKKMCEESLKAEDAVMVKIAEHFGRLCLGLDNYLLGQEKLWMVRHYQKMAGLGLPQLIKQNITDYRRMNMPDVIPNTNTADNRIACRQNCALNFPVMVRYWCQSSVTDNFRHLYPTYQELVNDPFFMIRRTIALGFNEVLMILGKNCHVLRTEFIKLLRDNAEEVLQGLVPQLGNSIVQMSKSGVMSPESILSGQDPVVFDIGRALLKCETEISTTNNWRLHTNMLGQLECLPHCVPPDFIQSHFVPVIFNRIHTARPVPCRMAAARTMLVFLRYSIKQVHRNSILSRFESDLRQSDNCYKRMLYAKLCAMALDLFSRKYFKEHFFIRFLELLDDRVPNIRYKIVTFLPALKSMISLPSDRKLLTAMESSIRKLLMQEKDRDVMAELRNAIQALDAIELRIDSNSTTLPLKKEDIEDQRKADEEDKLQTGGIQAITGKRKQVIDRKRTDPSTKQPLTSAVNGRRMYASNIPAVRSTSSAGPPPITAIAASRSGYSGTTYKKDQMASWPTNNIPQHIPPAYICLAKHNVIGCCSHSHLEFSHHNPSTCECREMQLQALNLLQENLLSPGDLSQLKVDDECAIHLRDVYEAGGDGTEMHGFGDGLPDQSDILKLEYKVYALGGMPNPHHAHWQYHRFNPSINNHPVTNHAISDCDPASRFIVSSLEDEFYVDAGIRIPQQLASSDLSPLPSRIPNLREILFKNRNTYNLHNITCENVSQPVPQNESRSESKDTETGTSDLESVHKVNTKGSSATAVSKSPSPVIATTKKTFIPSNISKRNSGIFTTKADMQSQQQSPKSKLTIASKPKSLINSTATNRRHSYMEGDKVIKVKSSDVSEEKKGSFISENRRHSYLEKIQVSTSEDSAEKSSDQFTGKKGTIRSQNLNETKLSTNTVSNRRHSYNPSIQGNRCDSEVPVLRRGAASNRHSVGPESRKSIGSQVQPKRGTSLDRETGTEVSVGNVVKRRSLIATSTVKHTVRRHSSLERDDMDRMSVRARVQGKRVENKFMSTNVQKELMIYSSDRKTASENIDLRKTEFSRSPQREFRSLDDVGACKGNHATKIPRGGGTSCHSSPGNSRASSPTIMICGSSSRLRQRTAPNSRASSPTGTEKLQQRLSLGSLNSYMGSLKISEPGTSRLPVRNYSRQK